MPRIAIYPGTGTEIPDRYVLSLMCARWRNAGFDPIVLARPERRIEAETAILHVDATQRPESFEQVLRNYPRVINGHVRDISKRRISDQVVSRDSCYTGPVIVKTDANNFGIPDFFDRRRRDGRICRHGMRVLNRLLIVAREIRRARCYPIYDHISQVPRFVWWDRRLVVEKFLPEKRDGLFCLRTWVFFGRREVVSLHLSPAPVVKRDNVVRTETLTEVPAEIRAARKRLGFDYGKFDFVIHNDQPVLLDTNATPTTSNTPGPRARAIADELAAGLLETLPNNCEVPLRFALAAQP